jgi:hypothetical protein
MIRVHLVVEVSPGHNSGETYTIDLAKTRSGDNPRYYASAARRVLLELAGHTDHALVAQFGDIGPTKAAAGDYLRPLPTVREWTT